MHGLESRASRPSARSGTHDHPREAPRRAAPGVIGRRARRSRPVRGLLGWRRRDAASHRHLAAIGRPPDHGATDHRRRRRARRRSDDLDLGHDRDDRTSRRSRRGCHHRGAPALGRPIVLAHTGGEDEFPGSTMFAFGESMKAGVDMLDLNVQLTERRRPGHPARRHCRPHDRTAPAMSPTWTSPTVQALDGAYWFTPSASAPAARTSTTCIAASAPASARRRRLHPRRLRRPDAAPAGSSATPTCPLNVEIEGDGERGTDGAHGPGRRAHRARTPRRHRVQRRSTTRGRDVRRVAPTAEISPGLGTSAAWVLTARRSQRRADPPAPAPSTRASTCSRPEVIAGSHAAGYLIWVWPNDDALENAAGYARLLAQGWTG